MRDWNRPCIVLDVDRTLCPLRTPEQSYSDLIPYPEMVEKVQAYHDQGWYVIIHTARQMRTHQCNQGRINATTLPMLIHWLNEHGIPFDEIWPDKPWCGYNGIYVDDSTISPQEFLTLPWPQIQATISSR